MLTDFAVLSDDIFGLHPSGPHRGVSLHSFDGNQMVLALILQEAVEDRFHKRKLTREDGNRLVCGDLKAIGTLISDKYMSRWNRRGTAGDLTRWFS
jgi:hypothetical protein